jgi:23S rRNA pseudoU1915 N3-methylase RlmH
VTVTVLSVGSPSRLLARPIQEYETRAGRYWKLVTRTVDPEKASRNRPEEDVMAAEAERLLAAVPDRTEVVALTRKGKTWTSRGMAAYLNRLAPGVRAADLAVSADSPPRPGPPCAG